MFSEEKYSHCEPVFNKNCRNFLAPQSLHDFISFFQNIQLHLTQLQNSLNVRIFFLRILENPQELVDTTTVTGSPGFYLYLPAWKILIIRKRQKL